MTITQSIESGSLTDRSESPASAAHLFHSDAWNARRDSGIPPLNQSELDSDPSRRQEFLDGARLLGVHEHDDATLKPQQLRTADVCNAPNRRVAILLPRRSAKTTSLFALVLGRCLNRPGYKVAYTQMTTGQQARERFREDVILVLERLWPDEASRNWRIYKAAGSERIEFSNGSSLRILVPSAEAFRGSAFDCVVLDEAGEADAAMSEDILQGLLPTFDTRPGAQLLVAGTAAEFRDGNLLWVSLERGRQGKASAGILEYASADTTDMTELETWEGAKALVLAAHPGISTEAVPDNLTTLDIAEERWEDFSPAKFSREYLSIFGTSGATEYFLNVQQWMDHGTDDAMPDMPTDRAVGLALTVHPDQSCAAITAAWRDDKGHACLLLVDYRQGTDWLAKRAKELAAKSRGTLVYDNAGPVLVTVEALQRMRPRPKLAPQTWANVSTAAALLAKEIADGNLVHWNQQELNTAVQLVTKRGTPTSNRWAFGRREPGHSIIAAEGISMALRWADENPRRANLRPKTVT